MHFVGRLFAAVRRVGNPVVVGIDPRPEELPAGFLERFPEGRQGLSEALHRFGCEIIDVVAPLVPAVKFQCAFYEAYGPAGVAALHATTQAARVTRPWEHDFPVPIREVVAHASTRPAGGAAAAPVRSPAAPQPGAAPTRPA